MSAEFETKAGLFSETPGVSQKSEMEKSVNENTQKEVKHRYCYTKDEMIAISKLACSRIRPKCLDNAFNSTNGLWNPEKWMSSRNGENTSGMKCETAISAAHKRDIQDTVKRKAYDQKERIKEELDDEIVLSPQRRSFGTGCHATAFRNEGRSRDNGHDGRETDHQAHRPRNTAQSRIGSGRLVGRGERGSDWSDRGVFDKERSFERTNYKDEESVRKGRYNRYEFDSRRSVNASRNRGFRESRNFEEDEPEWFTSGPTSQNETIELKGFDESEDVDKVASLTNESRNRRDSHSHNRSSSYGDLGCDEKRPRSRSSSNCNLSTSLTPVEKASEDNILRDQPNKDYSLEFDINEIFKMDNWKVSSMAMAENNISAPTNNENNSITNQAGTSRFAQWFSGETREQNLNEQFARQSSQVQSSSSEDLIHFFEKQNSLRSISGDDSEQQTMHQKSFVRNNDEKDIVNLLQKANINISGIFHGVPSAHLDSKSVKRVSDLEASLKESSSENVCDNSAFKKLIGCPTSRSGIDEGIAYEPHNIIDLLREDDLCAVNHQFASVDNSSDNSSLSFQNFSGKYGAQCELFPFLRQDNYDPKLNLLTKHPGHSTVSDFKSNKRDLRDQMHFFESPNDTLPTRNSAPPNIAAFTPTSVIRKFASEKEKEGFQKVMESDSSKFIGTSQHYPVNGVAATGGTSSTSLPRPIVKATNLQCAPLVQHQSTTSTNVYNNAECDSIVKFMEQQRHQQQAMTAATLTTQRHMNISPMPAMTGVRPGSSRTTNSTIRQTMPSAPISVNQNINVPLIRNVHGTAMTPPARNAQLNQLQFHLLQRGAATMDHRQLQALAQTRGLHPVAVQQLLIKTAANLQTQAAAAAAAVSAAQAQAIAVASLGLTGPRPLTQPLSPTRPLLRSDVKDSLHEMQNHANQLLYGHPEMQTQAGAQNPENLTKWFGNGVLNQTLSEMPPVPVQKAVLLEDIERQ